MANIFDRVMNGSSLASLWGTIDEKYGDIKRHGWKIRTVTEGYVAVPKTTGAVPNRVSGYAADTYTVSEDGLFVLVDPVKITGYSMLGKYWISNAEPTGATMYYTPSNAKETTISVPTRYPDGTVVWHEKYAFTPTTTYAVETGIAGGEWQYVFSEDRNAFPDTGVVDGMEYVYLGVPFENARNGVKMQTGSYVGTGVYGEANAVSITLDFVPKFFVCRATYSGSLTTIYPWALWVDGAGLLNSNGTACTTSVDGKTLAWYSKTDAKSQMNIAGAEMHWIAFG